MKDLTVTFHPQLAHTLENVVAMRALYFNQTGDEMCRILQFDSNPATPNPLGPDGVWGIVGPSGALFFADSTL